MQKIHFVTCTLCNDNRLNPTRERYLCWWDVWTPPLQLMCQSIEGNRLTLSSSSHTCRWYHAPYFTSAGEVSIILFSSPSSALHGPPGEPHLEGRAEQRVPLTAAGEEVDERMDGWVEWCQWQALSSVTAGAGYRYLSGSPWCVRLLMTVSSLDRVLVEVRLVNSFEEWVIVCHF